MLIPTGGKAQKKVEDEEYNPFMNDTVTTQKGSIERSWKVIEKETEEKKKEKPNENRTLPPRKVKKSVRRTWGGTCRHCATVRKLFGIFFFDCIIFLEKKKNRTDEMGHFTDDYGHVEDEKCNAGELSPAADALVTMMSESQRRSRGRKNEKEIQGEFKGVPVFHCHTTRMMTLDVSLMMKGTQSNGREIWFWRFNLRVTIVPHEIS